MAEKRSDMNVFSATVHWIAYAVWLVWQVLVAATDVVVDTCARARSRSRS